MLFPNDTLDQRGIVGDNAVHSSTQQSFSDSLVIDGINPYLQAMVVGEVHCFLGHLLAPNQNLSACFGNVAQRGAIEFSRKAKRLLSIRQAPGRAERAQY